MPPILALALTVLLVGYLFRRDFSQESRPSSAVWIPTIWMMIIGSRQVSQWLGIGATLQVQRLEEGSLIDQAVYGALIFAGVCVLARRQTRVGEIVRNNLFIVLFLLYEGASCVWSDFPGVAFRRWIKALGDPVMVLVLLSDPFPARAITATINRCAYVLIPLSVLFCKYYENLGRNFDGWGNSGYTGVTLNKNMLGYLLFAFGLYFVAAFMTTLDRSRAQRDQIRAERVVSILFLSMIAWLLLITNSATATVGLTIGIVIMIALQSVSVRKHFWSYASALIVLGTVVNAWFSLQGTIAEAAGRDPTFTGRTGLWETLLQEPINPLVGTGYTTFWLGERLVRYWAKYPTSPPIQAHNGYIETYLNLGLIGVGLLVCVLFSGLRRIRRSTGSPLSTLPAERLLAMFGLPFAVAYLFYNVTEAAFVGTNFLFVIFLMLACGGVAATVPQVRLTDGQNETVKLFPSRTRKAVVGGRRIAGKLQRMVAPEVSQTVRTDQHDNANHLVRNRRPYNGRHLSRRSIRDRT